MVFLYALSSNKYITEVSASAQIESPLVALHRE